MCLFIHILFALAIIANVHNLPLALSLIFASHFLLDILPHIDYSAENISEKKWKKSFFDFAKIAIDAFLGFVLIFSFSKNIAIGLIVGLLSILPDGVSFLEIIFPNKFFKTLNCWHQKLHYECKDKKTSLFWEVSIPLLIIILSLVFLLCSP